MYAILGTFVACLTGDYQAVADNMPWTWDADSASFTYCVHHSLPEYDVKVKGIKGDWRFVRIRVKDDGKVRFSRPTVFASRDNLLFVADFNYACTGCAVVAVDLSNGRQQWKTHLNGIGPVGHSEYSNQVTIEAIGEALIIRGNESSGRYVESKHGQ